MASPRPVCGRSHGHRDQVDREHDRGAEHRDRVKVAALIEVAGQDRQRLGLRREQVAADNSRITPMKMNVRAAHIVRVPNRELLNRTNKGTCCDCGGHA
jgi:hypothetical protein